MNNRPIGIFDSGIGGLTVVRELIRHLPYEDIVYFGDTARVPYGNKSQGTVLRFSVDNVLFLLKKNVKLIVVACNTASSVALPEIERHFKAPVVGVISPGAREAVYATKNKRIGIIGTRATIGSQAYDKELKNLDPQIKVFGVSCALFVPLVEEGWTGKNITKEVAKEYLTPLVKKDIDTLILGCTHYPLLKTVIRSVLGMRVRLIDSAEQVAFEVGRVLSQGGLAGNRKHKGEERYYVSDEPENFKKIAGMFLGCPLKRVERV